MRHNLKYLILLGLLATPFLVGNAIAYFGLANTVGVATALIAAAIYPAYCRMIDNDVRLGKTMTTEEYNQIDLQNSLDSINFNSTK